MYYVDLKTCLQQPISWIDEEGNYFFPNFVAGSTEEPNNIMEREDKEINEANESKLRKYSREFGAATKNVKVDDHAITTKTGDGNVAIEDVITLNLYMENWMWILHRRCFLQE